MAYLDPTTVRISDNFLLSDVMGCSSVYGVGYSNKFEANWTEKLAEGRFLGEHLDQIQDLLGPFSVCYGFISPSLSRKIVTYQSPDKLSFHRWDLGAAVDICLHAQVRKYAPISTAHYIDDCIEYSRMITYSESEWICFGTKLSEKDTGLAQKLYENRYIGEKKPLFIRYSDNVETRNRQKDEIVLTHPWKGQGFPSYHGGGRRQYEHHRVSDYSVITDYLYDKHLVHKGVPNPPPILYLDKWHKWKRCAVMAGKVVDLIAINFNSRVSVVRAYNNTIPAQDWSKYFTLELVLPPRLSIDDVANEVSKLPEVAIVSVSKHKVPRLQIMGEAI